VTKMAERNEARIRFTAETREFNEEIRNINSEMAELRSELKLNQTQMQGAGDSTDYLQEQYKILQRQFEISQNKTQAINEKLQVAIRIYGENSTEVNRLRIALNEAMTQEERMRQAVRTCGNAIDEQQAAAQDTRNSLERLTDTVSQQENRLDELRRAYQNAVLEQGQESQEARSLAQDINNLSGELQENRSELQRAESAADSLGNAMEETGDSAEKSSEGYTIMKDVVADLASEAIQSCIDAFGELTAEGEAALDKLQAATGVSAETMEQYKDTMYEVYNGAYGESLEDVGKSMTTIIQMMGELDGSELESVMTKALTLRDVYDMDVQESVRAANQMMKQFGITSDEAYNLIAQGSQKGLNANGDLLDIINEYSVHYAQLGLSAEDMFNTLTGAAEEGVFSLDKVGDAMKEFGIRVKDGSDTTNEAFKMLGYGANASEEEIEKINNTINTLEKNLQYAQMEQQGFNEKTSELTKLKNADKIKQYLEELENARQALSDITKESGGTRGNIEDLQAAFAKGGEDAQNAYWEVWNALSEVDDEVERNTIGVNLFGTMWEDLGDKAITSAMGMNDEFNSTIDTMGEIDDIAYGNVQSQLTSLGRTLKSELLQPIVDKIMPHVTSFVVYLKDNVPQIKQILSDALRTLKDWIPAIGMIGISLATYFVIGKITGFVNAIKSGSAALKLMTASQKALNFVMNLNPMGLIIGGIAGLVAGFIYLWNYCESFRQFWINLWDNIRSFILVAVDIVVGFFQSAWDKIVAAWNVAIAFFQMIFDGIKNVFSFIGETLTGFFKSAWDGIVIVWNVAIAFFQAIFNGIKNVFSFIGETLTGFFRSAWDGIVIVWNGTASFFQTIWDNIKLIFSSVSSFFISVFQNGYNGITGLFGNIVGFFKDIWNKIVNIFKNIGNTIGDAIKNTVATAINGVLSTAVNIINGFISAINFAIGAINAIPGVKIDKLKKLEVPKLAEGGIAIKETLAIIGEGKESEAIAPISKLQGYVSNAVEAANSKNNMYEMMSELKQIKTAIDNGKDIYLDGYKVSKRTGVYDDKNSGRRIQLNGRGVMV